jgi:hypothetical protein
MLEDWKNIKSEDWNDGRMGRMDWGKNGKTANRNGGRMEWAVGINGKCPPNFHLSGSFAMFLSG